LKEKRLGPGVRLSGANQRSAWAFTLWGDPTLHLPRPEPPEEALPAVRHEGRGSTIVLTLPGRPHDKGTTPKYQGQMVPNSGPAGEGAGRRRGRPPPRAVPVRGGTLAEGAQGQDAAAEEPAAGTELGVLLGRTAVVWLSAGDATGARRAGGALSHRVGRRITE